MKRFIIYLFIIINSISVFGQAQKHVNLFVGKGVPIGKTYYNTDSYKSAALFANMSSNTHFGLESHYVLNEKFTLGYLMQVTHYAKWNEQNYSNRYNNVSLNTFDLGLVLGYELDNLSFSVFKSRVLFTPMSSLVKFKNDNSYYTIQGQYFVNGVLRRSTLEMNESAKSFMQILPAANVALEYSFPIVSSIGGFVRGGITAGLAKSDYYPDKYYVYPTVSLGFAFDREQGFGISSDGVISHDNVEAIKYSEGVIRDFCFSPNFAKIYIANDNSLSIWDLKKRSVIGNLDNEKSNKYNSIDVSPDGNYLAATSPDGNISVWSLSNSQLINSISTSKLDLNKVKFVSGSSQLLVTAKSGEIMRYNVVSGSLDKSVNFISTITNFSVDDSVGIVGVTCDNGDVALLNFATLKIIFKQHVHDGTANDIVFINDKNKFYTCGNDGKVYKHRIKENNFVTEVVNGKFGSGNILSLDIMSDNSIAYAEPKKAYIFTRFSGFKLKSKIAISKIRFIHRDDFIVVAYATTDGIYVANSLDLEGVDSVIPF
jgi:hypothetical protein